MSRSYRKFPLVFKKIPSCFQEDFKCSHMRKLERQCIHREMLAYDYGDVIFPEDIPRAIRHPCYIYQEYTIRQDYNIEIRKILNGLIGYFEEDFEASFLECYAQIRDCNSYIPSLCFEWLNTKEAKRAIRDWKGEPLEVLSYLNHHRIIEKAVKIKHRRMVRK